ncbi:MAG TPA: DmsE family decaheme c-type cytochrome [Candidatus Polarisedimenticolaceae bacterium]|nr:DmsE family decaheme c-type cytochrome [Candidatus Polarisedimenticolaceae bacterium]
MRRSAFLFASLLFTAAAVRAAETSAPHAVGADVCVSCHEAEGASLRHYADHPGVADCEGCHGPGSAHVEAGGDATKIVNPAKLAPAAAAKTCLGCHDQQHVRDWPGSIHQQNDLSCLSCHAIHNKDGKNASLLKFPVQADVCFACHKMQRIQTMMSSHMPLRESKMQCSDCHNPHGTTTKALLVDASVNDNCYRCHMEKRGPVLFEHPPVREDCLNCHDPHGSLHDNLLVATPPRLCQSCHLGTSHPGQPRDGKSRFVFNKSCVNCHTQIHGSQSPNGSALMR